MIDNKEGNIDVDRKNGGIDADAKKMEDDEGNVEDFGMDTKSIIDSDTNIVNLGEANKSIENTTSAFLGAVRKKVVNIDERCLEGQKRSG